MANPNVVTRDTVLPDRLLDVYEVADILDCCTATVRREVKRDRLRGTKVGSRLRFQPDDIAAYLDGQSPASTAERTAWDAYIRKVVAEAPQLTPEQIAALSALLDWEPDKAVRRDSPRRARPPRHHHRDGTSPSRPRRRS